MSRLTYRRGLIWGALGTTLMVAAAACSSSGSSSGAAQSSAQPTVTASAPASLDLSHPTKALCKKSSYKIGYDVFSDSQPFAVSLSNGLKAAAASVGCAQVLQTVDNQNGPVAIGNLHTLINEGINGFVDFQVLAQYQPAMSKILKSSKIPSVTVVGATLPGFPQVGLDPFNTEKNAAMYMANVAKTKYPGQVPYFVGGAEPESGAAVLLRYQGAVAGVKAVFPNIPKNHIIEVDTNGVDTQAYNNTLSALSAVPKNAVVMIQAVNDEDTGGMAKAAASRGLPNYMVNSYGGDSYGLSQVCANSHYVGSWYLDPSGWGPVLLSLEMDEMNGVKVPQVTNIAGYEVTAKTAFLKCSS
jgi:ABC-type sugar transport system substrate-binding protein